MSVVLIKNYDDDDDVLVFQYFIAKTSMFKFVLNNEHYRTLNVHGYVNLSCTFQSEQPNTKLAVGKCSRH